MTRQNRRHLRAVSLLFVAELVLGSRSSALASPGAGPECSVESDLSRLPSVMAQAGGAGTSASGCSSSKGSQATGPSARLSCPYRILDRLSKDQKKGWMKDSPAEACEVSVSAATESSVSEIEGRLARNPSSSLSAAADQLQQSCGASIGSLPGESQKIVTAEFYVDMNRLKQAEVSSYESITAIDSVLGRKPLLDVACADSRLPEVDRSCRALQACPASGGLKEQAEEIRQAWPLLVELERRISAGEAARKAQLTGAAYGARLDSRALSDVDASVENARRLLSQLKASYPAIDGKEFRKALNPKQGNFEEALTRQLASTRSKLVEESAKYRNAMECLNSPLTCGKCGDYDKVLARAPPFEATRFSGPGRASTAERQKDLAVQSYLAAADCRQRIRGARAEASKAVTDFAVGAGLTVATAGLGTIAAGARAVSAAAAATTAGRAGAVLTRPLVTVSVSSRTAAVARLAILGTDLAFAGEGVQNAMKECDQLLNQLSSSESGGTGGAHCPGAVQSKQVQLLADYRACALSATLNIAPNLLPFAPAFVKAYREGATRAAGRAVVATRSNPSSFVPIREVESLAQSSGGRVGIVVLDANSLSPAQAERLGISVIDHHGAYRNPSKPFQNTTRKVVDLYEEAAGSVGPKADAQEVREAFQRRLLGIPKDKPLPESIHVATDNLGDAALAKWLIDHPDALQSADSRRLFKMAAFHEDYAHFGTQYREYASGPGGAAGNFSESVEFAQSVMAANDRIIRKYNAEAARAGRPPVFVGDRFSDAAPELQQRIMAESVAEIDLALKDPAHRKQLADELRENIRGAVPEIQSRALVRTADSKLATKASTELGSEEVGRVLQDRLAIIDGDKLDSRRGQFTNWGAIPEAHSNPLQLQLNDRTGADSRTFILAIPQGRKDQGLISENLRQAIIDAAQAKDPNFNPQGVVLRDSGLLFSFAGVPLSKQEISATVIRHVSSADGFVKPPRLPAPANQ